MEEHSFNKVLFFITLILFCNEVLAKNLKVVSFKPDPFDLSASVNQKLDNNGEPCALIKLALSDEIRNVSFEGNIIDVVNDGSEIKAYFTSGTKIIVVKSPGYSPLKLIFSDFGVYKLFPKLVYNLSLKSGTNENKASNNVSIHELLDVSQGDDPIEEMVSEANRLYMEGKVSEAIPLLEKASEVGHADALLSLGLLYEKGVENVLVKNPAKAFLNVQKSAQQGFIPAQKVLSRYYLIGLGVDANKEIGDVWKTIYDKNISQNDHQSEDNEVFTSIDLLPEYPGAPSQLFKDLSKYLVYPESAQKNGISGKVTLMFVVKKDGSIENIRVVKGVNNDLDAAAVNAVRRLKKFYPGKMNGFPVNCWYTLPVNFTLF